jgi:hypothetical protein
VTRDEELREFVTAIVGGDKASFSRQLAASPELARARFEAGASRQSAQSFFIGAVGRYIVAGDTALHFAAAAYRPDFAKELIAAGADVHAGNRFGDQPIHAAAKGNPNSARWNPDLQTATIRTLVEAGADPDAVNKRGVAPLHVAVRTRTAAAVRTLLSLGVDPARKNKSGSTPLILAKYTTGRGGSGSPEAKAQQQEILSLLQQALGAPS